MNDERYDRNADMRLLELQREALGVPRHVIGTTSYTDPDSSDGAQPDDVDPYVASGTILIAAVNAQPRSGLIPGALVTVSVSITNDGDVRSKGVRLSLPLPLATLYRPGSLSVDGVAGSDDSAAELLADGAEFAPIEPGTRRTVSLKLAIEAGIADITLTPHLAAPAAAVLGLRAMRLLRAPVGRIAAVPRPFYESDDDEHRVEPLDPLPLASVAALQPTEMPAPPNAPKPASRRAHPRVTPLGSATPPAPALTNLKQPRSIRPPGAPDAAHDAAAATSAVATDAGIASVPTVKSKSAGKRASEAKTAPRPRGSKAEPKPAAKRAARTPAVPARPTIEVVRSHDEGIAFAGQGGPILCVRFDRKRLATLGALFGGPSFGMLAHYLVLNALATRDPLPGDGADATIANFVADQEQLLSRALIATRLGKSPSAESLGAVLPAFPPALPVHSERRSVAAPPPGQLLLFRAFRPTEVVFVQRMLSNDRATAFMRASQLFVGLGANDAVLADNSRRAQVGVALTAYAALATGIISRIFLRAKLEGTPDLFKATDVAFDDAARTVLAALSRALE